MIRVLVVLLAMFFLSWISEDRLHQNFDELANSTQPEMSQGALMALDVEPLVRAIHSGEVIVAGFVLFAGLLLCIFRSDTFKDTFECFWLISLVALVLFSFGAVVLEGLADGYEAQFHFVPETSCSLLSSIFLELLSLSFAVSLFFFEPPENWLT